MGFHRHIKTHVISEGTDMLLAWTIKGREIWSQRKTHCENTQKNNVVKLTNMFKVAFKIHFKCRIKHTQIIYIKELF